MTALSPEFVSTSLDLLRWVSNGYENAKDPAERREWSVRQLELVVRLAREIDPAVDHDALLIPLQRLRFSLYSLDYGVTDPSLKAAKQTAGLRIRAGRCSEAAQQRRPNC
jgi:hypothetical protein